jgi:hypothetical protein
MAREKKPVQLRTIDEDVVEPTPVVRLANYETGWKEKESNPIRLGGAVADAGTSERLDLPAKEEFELRTHQPGIEAIIETEAALPEPLEQNWGIEAIRRNPVPWGWFVLIGAAIVGAVIWSLTRVQEAEVQAKQILVDTQAALIDEEKEQREAGQLIDRIDHTLRDFFTATTVDAKIRMVRQPERVGPLMRGYYKDRPVFNGGLKVIKSMRPVTLDRFGNFWIATVVLADGKITNLIVEIMDSGDVLMDWETLVCHQPMSWDDFAAKKSTGTSLDFRVYLERDDFFSHEFADARRWNCYRLTAFGGEQTLFGYAAVGSTEAEALSKLIDENGGRKCSAILRLLMPDAMQSKNGVVIEKLLSPRWIYLVPPTAGS